MTRARLPSYDWSQHIQYVGLAAERLDAWRDAVEARGADSPEVARAYSMFRTALGIGYPFTVAFGEADWPGYARRHPDVAAAVERVEAAVAAGFQADGQAEGPDSPLWAAYFDAVAVLEAAVRDEQGDGPPVATLGAVRFYAPKFWSTDGGKTRRECEEDAWHFAVLVAQADARGFRLTRAVRRANPLLQGSVKASELWDKLPPEIRGRIARAGRGGAWRPQADRRE